MQNFNTLILPQQHYLGSLIVLIFATMNRPLNEDIFTIQTETQFEKVALATFKYQFEHNSLYRSFCDLLFINPADVSTYRDIPFLPIQFFKSHTVVSNTATTQTVFSSSGTTGQITSKHHVTDLSIYTESFSRGFTHFYGNINEYAVLALLPSYLERKGSSLVYMVNDLITKSNHPESGFYLNNHEELGKKLNELEQKKQKTLLIGVSFALLDLIKHQTFSLKNTIVMETGGMKGRRKELIRPELHKLLKKGFGVDVIHSEYGMTELLSQAYAKGERFFTPPWMKIIARDTEDPLTILPYNKTGGANIIDLANINSCAFIATQDLTKTYSDQSFEILGRFDQSDIRGCNLMAL